jgi:hypothetical protein
MRERGRTVTYMDQLWTLLMLMENFDFYMMSLFFLSDSHFGSDKFVFYWAIVVCSERCSFLLSARSSPRWFCGRSGLQSPGFSPVVSSHWVHRPEPVLWSVFFYFPDLVISVRLQCTDPSFQSVLRGLCLPVSSCCCFGLPLYLFSSAAPLVPTLILGHGNRSISPGRRFLQLVLLECVSVRVQVLLRVCWLQFALVFWLCISAWVWIIIGEVGIVFELSDQKTRGFVV